MSTLESAPISDHVQNVVENLAARLARRRAGRVPPHALMPYLAASLALIRTCLDRMADGSAVRADTDDGLPVYVFTAQTDAPMDPKPLAEETCLSCGDARALPGEIFCGPCALRLRDELGRLAESTGWPARAVYEHELLYLACAHTGPVRAEDLAARSRYTLRRMRGKLRALCAAGFAAEEREPGTDLVRYRFPDMAYPRDRYRANMSFIRTHPASLQEDIEYTAVRIIVALALMLLAVFVLVLFHVPLLFLLAGYLALAPLVSLWIWRERFRPVAD